MDGDPEPNDPLAELDQALAGLATRAKVLYAFYGSLIEQGFNPQQALELTISYQAKWPA